MSESQSPCSSQEWNEFKLENHLIELYEQYRANNPPEGSSQFYGDEFVPRMPLCAKAVIDKEPHGCRKCGWCCRESCRLGDLLELVPILTYLEKTKWEDKAYHQNKKNFDSRKHFLLSYWDSITTKAFLIQDDKIVEAEQWITKLKPRTWAQAFFFPEGIFSDRRSCVFLTFSYGAYPCYLHVSLKDGSIMKPVEGLTKEPFTRLSTGKWVSLTDEYLKQFVRNDQIGNPRYDHPIRKEDEPPNEWAVRVLHAIENVKKDAKLKRSRISIEPL